MSILCWNTRGLGNLGAMLRTIVCKHSPRLVFLSETKLSVAKLENVVVRNQEQVKRQFRFEPHWLKEEECRSIVIDAWQKCTLDVADPLGLWESHDYCGKCLSTWNMQRFGSLPKQFKETREEIDKVMDVNALDVRMDERRALLEAEIEIRVDDRNMEYFHNKALLRKKKNPITEIMTKSRQKLCVEEDIDGEVE
ncbi:hypothetical protein G4B88_020953 [Cannabis sativa]|uniref:Uncharacterized protein n=1 Tax=Cannabis sativa TaxID=3483 RepID=A0A7J6EK25_CANSA|nr:hypothetical protein G4B88_020953 [Cannabis sativa]